MAERKTDIQSEELEQYALLHSDPEPELLREMYRDAHCSLLRPRMLSGALQGRVLKMLCQMVRPSRILELGTYAGYSALCMAEALEEGGRLDTIEVDDEMEEFIRKYLDRSPYGSKVNLLIGDAIDLIPGLTDSYDLVFIDADKRLYNEYYDLVFDKIRPGGFIFADNTLWDGKVIEPLHSNDKQTAGILSFNERIGRDQRVEKIILPLRDGITLIRKKQ